MINVSLENETDWIVKGTVTSDVDEINLEDDEFRIELKDLLEHYVKRKSSSDLVESYQKDSTQTLSISNNEVKLVPLKCPICKGTGLASNTYPPGRSINNTTDENGIIEVNNSVFFNPIIQLSDYDKLPETYFTEEYLNEFYPNLSEDVKNILTYTDDKPHCNPALYKIEGNNEYYYYKEDDLVVGGTTYKIRKRQKYSIVTNVATEELNTKFKYCQDDDGYSTGIDPNAYTICGDEKKRILTEEFYTNVSIYNNSDMKSLIENGFQFWISENKKELHFRLTMRGISNINPNGYEDKLKTELYHNGLYVSATDDIVVDDESTTFYSGRVGFTLAICTISLDSTHRICFNITVAPTIKSSDIFRVDNLPDIISQIPTLPYKVCPVCDDTHYQISYSSFENNTIKPKQILECDACNDSGYFMDRYAYPYYNSTKVDNMIFLNNHSATYSSTYDTYWDNNKYVTSSTNDYDATRTNLYAAYTSAIIPNYLVTGSTIDVLSPTQENPIYTTAKRYFEFCYDEGVVSSYLLDSDKSRFCELPWDGNENILNGFVYVEENGACIYDDLNVNLIRQDIDIGVSGVTIDDMVGKTVFFGIEV